MPIKLIAPVEEEFILTKTDEAYGEEGGEPTRVTIRQATQSQNERRFKVFEKLTQQLSDDLGSEAIIQTIQRINLHELRRIEVNLTMIGCNLMDEDGTPLFAFKKFGDRQYLDMSDEEFRKAWGKLPPDIAYEISDKVLEVNKLWRGPMGED